MAATGIRYRIVGGPIPKDVSIFVAAQPHDIIASLLATADDELRRQLLLRGSSAATMWETGQLIHPKNFEVLQLAVVGGNHGKVVAIVDPDDKVKSLAQNATSAETLLLLRPRSIIPPGVPRGPQQKTLALSAPFVIPKTIVKPKTPPPAKPDLSLRIVGGPIPKDCRIVIKVFRTTTFMDMFPLIHEKVELVAPMAMVSARYFNLYEFEIVAHGKGKKRRALFAKDTPASMSLISNVLMLEEKPIWQHVMTNKTTSNSGSDSEAESDHLSDIRPASATSTLRERDVDTPPNTVGARNRDGLTTAGSHTVEHDLEDAGWWEQRESASAGKRLLTLDEVKRKEQHKAQEHVFGVAKQILELVAPQNQQAQLIRVIGKPIPRTARVIIDIIRTQTFISFFPLIQAKVVEFVPQAQVTPYKYELVELQLLANGKAKEVRGLQLHDTPWTADFGLASVLLLREIPNGLLQGAEGEPNLSSLAFKYDSMGRSGADAAQGGAAQVLNKRSMEREVDPGTEDTVMATKPGTAVSIASAVTVVALAGASTAVNHNPSVSAGDFEDIDVGDVDNLQLDFEDNDVQDESRHDNVTEPRTNTVPAATELAEPKAVSPRPSTNEMSNNVNITCNTAQRTPVSTVPLDVSDLPTEHLQPPSGAPQRSPSPVAPPLSEASPLSKVFSSPVRRDSQRIVDIEVSDDDADAQRREEPDNAASASPHRSSSVAQLVPARASNKYLLYQEDVFSSNSEKPQPQLPSEGAPSSRMPTTSEVAQVLSQANVANTSLPVPPISEAAILLPNSVLLHDEIDIIDGDHVSANRTTRPPAVISSKSRAHWDSDDD